MTFRGWVARAAWTLVITETLSGCLLGPNYHGVPPQATTDVPHHYKNAPGGNERWGLAVPNEAALGGRWWLIFHDSTLDQLETATLINNQDLKIAVNRIDQARAETRLATADLVPTLGANSGFTDQRSSSTLSPQPGRLVGSLSGLTGSSGGPQYTGSNGPLLVEQPISTESDLFNHNLELNWELDIFGRIRRNVESAKASKQEAVYDLLASQLSVAANVAVEYFTVRAFDTEISVLQATIATRQDALKIAEERLESGLTSELDVQRARSDLASNQADLFAVRRSRGEVENAIATLTGQPASNLRLPFNPLENRPPRVPPGLPATLLERRPDVAAAERAVAAANAKIGAAVAAFYPTVRLNGASGFETANVGDIFAGQSLIWSLGPSVTIPIFEGGRNAANLDIANSVYQQTVNQYRAQVLIAFQDVENALVDLRTLAGQASAQETAITAARRSLELSEEQYAKGASGFLDVLDAERTLLQDQRVLAQLQGARMETTVQLIKAIGGTWEENSRLADSR
jgi:outer membrane protein, multidrug efflux system